MKYVMALIAFLTVVALGSFAYRTIRIAQQGYAVAKAEVTKWQARYAEEASKALPVAETVRVVADGVKVRRDTVLLNLHDTILVKQFVYATDTLIVACEKCAAQLVRLKWTADSTINSLHYALRRQNGFRQRVGFFAGYGISGGQESSVRHGVVIGVGVRVFP